MRKHTLPAITIILFIILAFIGISYYLETQERDEDLTGRENIIEETTRLAETQDGEVDEIEAIITVKDEAISSLSEEHSYSKKGTFYIVGYSKELERGVVMPMEVEINHGQGRVLLDTAGIAVDKDTLLSMRIAKTVAQRVTGAELTAKDVIFTFKNTFPMAVEMEGPSAGAAMTVLLISVLENRSIKEGYLITGVINYNGTIGRVAFITNKIQGAKEFNATALVVPRGLGVRVEGLEVIEAGTIQEAAEVILEP